MVEALLNQYSPYFVFHRDENIYPKDFDLYLEESRLIRGGETRVRGGCCAVPHTPVVLSCQPTSRETISGEVVYDKGEVSSELEEIDGKGSDCYLEYSGERLWALRNDTPIYSWKKDVDVGVELTYCHFYAYQHSYNIGFERCPLYVGGGHQADVETVRVRVIGGKIDGVFYYEHGKAHYYGSEDIEFIEGHPLVYVSLVSHASYPKPGIYTRLLGFANDKCSRLDDGRLWKPEKMLDIGKLDERNFMRWYRGRLGNDGIASFGSRLDKVGS